MNISKASGTYRVINYVFKNPAKSICAYFWQFVYSTLVCIAVPLIAILPWMVVVSGVGIEQLGLAPVMLLLLSPCLIIGIAAYVSAIIFGVLSVFTALTVIGASSVAPHASNSIVIQYAKAKKDKVCPTITFKN